MITIYNNELFSYVNCKRELCTIKNNKLYNICSNFFKTNNKNIKYNNDNSAIFNYINDKRVLCTIKINYYFNVAKNYWDFHFYKYNNNNLGLYYITSLKYFNKKDFDLSYIYSKTKNDNTIIYNEHKIISSKQNNSIIINYIDTKTKIIKKLFINNFNIIKYKIFKNNIWYLIKYHILEKINKRTVVFYNICYNNIYIYNKLNATIPSIIWYSDYYKIKLIIF